MKCYDTVIRTNAGLNVWYVRVGNRFLWVGVCVTVKVRIWGSKLGFGVGGWKIGYGCGWS